MTKLEEMLRVDEGFKRFVYKCTAGKWTIGVGRNISAGGMGLSDDEILYLLRNDIKRVYEELDNTFDWFAELDDVRQDCLQNLCFNIGLPNLLKFKRMIAAIELGQFDLAADEMLDSRWAEQVQNSRSQRLARMMRTGEY